MRFLVFTCLLLFEHFSFADIKGIDGTIKFDINSDQLSEMVLSTTGLSVGASLASANLEVTGNAIITETVTVGNATSHSNLNLNGTYGMSIQTISSNASLNDHSIAFLDTSSDNIVVNLPYAGNATNRIYQLKKISNLNSAYVTGGGNSIDNLTAVELTSFSGFSAISNGSKWLVIDNYGSLATIASDNLVAWYTFEQTSGNVLNDSSIQNNAGNLVSGLSFSSDSVTGKISRALRFDGASDYITLNSTSTLLSGDTSLTASIWFKTTTLHNTADNNVGGRLLTLYRTDIGLNGSKLAVCFYGNGTDTLHILYHHGSFSNLLKTSSGYNDNNWHHIATTYDHISNNLVLYYDGLAVNSVNAGTITSSGNQFARLGAFSGAANEKFDGDMDDVRIYNTALTPLQIQALFMLGH